MGCQLLLILHCLCCDITEKGLTHLLSLYAPHPNWNIQYFLATSIKGKLSHMPTEHYILQEYGSRMLPKEGTWLLRAARTGQASLCQARPLHWSFIDSIRNHTQWQRFNMNSLPVLPISSWSLFKTLLCIFLESQLEDSFRWAYLPCAQTSALIETCPCQILSLMLIFLACGKQGNHTTKKKTEAQQEVTSPRPNHHEVNA